MAGPGHHAADVISTTEFFANVKMLNKHFRTFGEARVVSTEPKETKFELSNTLIFEKSQNSQISYLALLL